MELLKSQNMVIDSDNYMLGELIAEEKGKVTSQRVLDVERGEPTMETSQQQGSIEV